VAGASFPSSKNEVAQIINVTWEKVGGNNFLQQEI
jgi:hypothetical protein